VPGEDIFCALISAVCTDLRGAAENPDLMSCDGGFLRAFRQQMRGFHDLFRQKPSSLFILLGWSSIPVASLMIKLHVREVHGDDVTRTELRILCNDVPRITGAKPCCRGTR
jgi:hypothetical protein